MALQIEVVQRLRRAQALAISLNKGQFSGQHAKEQHRSGVAITIWRRSWASEGFGRLVDWRTGGTTLGIEGDGKAKIDQHEALILLVDQQIGRLHIAMEQPMPLQRSQCLEQLARPLPPEIERQWKLRLPLHECPPGNILHLQVDVIGGLVELKDAWYMATTQLLERSELCFGLPQGNLGMAELLHGKDALIRMLQIRYEEGTGHRPLTK